MIQIILNEIENRIPVPYFANALNTGQPVRLGWQFSYT